jgi:hypothetical protein
MTGPTGDIRYGGRSRLAERSCNTPTLRSVGAAGSACAFAALLLVFGVMDPYRFIVDTPMFTGFLLVSLICSTLALPSWHALTNSTREAPMVTYRDSPAATWNT